MGLITTDNLPPGTYSVELQEINIQMLDGPPKRGVYYEFQVLDGPLEGKIILGRVPIEKFDASNRFFDDLEDDTGSLIVGERQYNGVACPWIESFISTDGATFDLDCTCGAFSSPQC